ncbi:hypothetical protein C5E10_18260 [Pseudoclavibacter sp. RFBG4]|jgi:hypothetical protein|nr:hypothetical protein C5E10_18260 [Pseudoclavibacter sp. RFBG4]
MLDSVSSASANMELDACQNRTISTVDASAQVVTAARVALMERHSADCCTGESATGEAQRVDD